MLSSCAGKLWTATLKDGSGRAAVRRVIASDNSCLFNAVGYVMERSRDRAPELRHAPVSLAVMHRRSDAAAVPVRGKGQAEPGRSSKPDQRAYAIFHALPPCLCISAWRMQTACSRPCHQL